MQKIRTFWKLLLIKNVINLRNFHESFKCLLKKKSTKMSTKCKKKVFFMKDLNAWLHLSFKHSSFAQNSFKTISQSKVSAYFNLTQFFVARRTHSAHKVPFESFEAR